MTGAGPLPAFGPAGAGLGSLLVATASLAILAAIGRRGRPRAPAPAGVDWRGLATVLRVGLPIGIATVAEVGIFLAATIYAATLGAADVAAHTLGAADRRRRLRRPDRAPAGRDGPRRPRRTLGDPGLRPRRRHRQPRASPRRRRAALRRCSPPARGRSPTASSTPAPSASPPPASPRGLLLLLGLMEFVAGPGLAAAGLLRGRKDTRAPMLFSLLGHWAVGAPVGLCPLRGSSGSASSASGSA